MCGALFITEVVNDVTSWVVRKFSALKFHNNFPTMKIETKSILETKSFFSYQHWNHISEEFKFTFQSEILNLN